MEWYLKVVRDNYANFTGRAQRIEYWMFLLVNMFFSLVAAILDNIAGTTFYFGGEPVLFNYGWIYLLYSIAIFIPGFAVFVRRLHDTGRTGWWFLIAVIPFIGAVWLFVLTVLDSDPYENKYGASPKESLGEE
ncbi:MAG: DUF805 domain-containing protein [Candidatus Marinimicrobia bacterium]|nr:DUF805 domain-containing protein [Candidatus Neomarinimicrobiota bacterium]MBL7109022.1 DUF805 domain-containing protein [Candidatus Neomarinimicrobiota bacterium]